MMFQDYENRRLQYLRADAGSLLNPFLTNPLVVVYGLGGMDSTIIIISAPKGARRLIFYHDVHVSKINQ